MSVISSEDVSYLTQQSAGQLNMIISGMTALMQDTDEKTATMASQTWYQRMLKTVTGKNKATVAEIQQNHDRLNIYMSEAIGALYQRECIDLRIMNSLGNQINELVSDNALIRQTMGALANKLNEKIDSVDNFHLLITEIDQGRYSTGSSIASICEILAQVEHRTLADERKLLALKQSMMKQNIVSGDGKTLADYLLEVTNIPMEEIGQIYLELGSIRTDFMASLIMQVVEKYHFLPETERKLKSKKSIVDDIVVQNGLDSSAILSTAFIIDSFFDSKKQNIYLAQSNGEVCNKNSFVAADDGESVYQRIGLNHINLDEFFEKNENGTIEDFLTATGFKTGRIRWWKWWK